MRSRALVDFEYYAQMALKVLTKRGLIVPLGLNRAQAYVHKRAQQQLLRRGYVRMIVPKARQLGISTYIEGRFFHRTTMNRGNWAFILTHEDEATKKIFGMADMFYKYCPLMFKPRADRANANEMAFGALESGYKVGTAGAKATGRGGTFRLFHGCLSPDTWIVGEHGHARRMGEVAVGDLVRTHTGALAPVSFISRQRKAAMAITLKGMGSLPLLATGEHKFWTLGGWRELAELEAGDSLLFPVTTIVDAGVEWAFRAPARERAQGGGSQASGPETVRPSYELGRVLGLYLAEGCIVKQHKSGEPSAVTFAVHEREAARTEQWLDALPELFVSRSTATRTGSKTVTVTAYSRSLATFVLHLCGQKDDKRLPAEWMKCGEPFARGLVHGYFAGDGHSSRREYDRRISAPSIRSAITFGMRDALAALEYGWAGVNYRPAAVRNGRNERPQWILRLCGAGVDRLCSELGWTMPERRRNGAYGGAFVKDGYAHVPIVDVEDVGEIDVMDFEVGHEDHSYCTVHAATHNSEVAFWPNAIEHVAGVMQSVPKGRDGNGTEVWLESSVNGMGNYFHAECQDALNGTGEYEFVFIPWFWDEGYRLPVDKKFRLDDDEAEYAETHKLDREQMAWRRAKIAELKDIEKFKQEYPATIEEAFSAGVGQTYLPLPHIERARKCDTADPFGPVVFGVDPARFGFDETAFCIREGRYVHGIQTRHGWDTNAIVGWVVSEAKVWRPRRIFVDLGYNPGVYDNLAALGLPVTGVTFGEAAIDSEQYFNKRCEMYGGLKDWLAEAPVRIPDDDQLAAQLLSHKIKRYDSRGRFVLVDKDVIRKEQGVSPDKADALALTFAAPVPVFAQESFEPGAAPQGGAGAESFEPEVS